MNGQDRAPSAAFRGASVSVGAGVGAVELARVGEDLYLIRIGGARGPFLCFPRAEVEAFIHAAKEGEFDDMLGPGV